MSLIRKCDVGGCPRDALVMVGFYEESGEKLEDTADACSTAHASKLIKEWLKAVADIDEGAA